MIILSQRDSRWANIKLGTSNVTISGYGCTITSLAMMCGLTPDQVNQILRDNGGYANQNLVIWAKVNLLPGLEFEWRGYQYDNDRVKEAITKYGGCLVEVDFDRTDRVDNRHWVVYVGGGRIYDPWTGTEESIIKYKALGFSVIKRNSPVDYELLKTKIKELEEDKATLDKEKKEWEKKAVYLETERKNREEQVGRLKDQLLEEKNL